MIGKLLYRARKKFGHGLRTAYLRDHVRPKILKSAPVEGLTDDSCEIHVLTCQFDWLDLIWGLKTLFTFSDCRYRLCVHEDGSVPKEGIHAIQQHFPDAKIVLREDSDRVASKQLSGFPRCRELRSHNVLSLKVFDFAAHLRSDRLFLLDCDILFFSNPTVLLNRLKDPKFTRNSLNRDWANGYSIDINSCTSLVDFPIQPLVNSGLGLMHRESYNLQWFEEFLGLPNVLSHSHRIEQTLIGLACSRFGHTFLPPEYDVINGPRDGQPVKHYTGPIRHLLYRQGLPVTRKLLNEF